MPTTPKTYALHDQLVIKEMIIEDCIDWFLNTSDEPKGSSWINYLLDRNSSVDIGMIIQIKDIVDVNIENEFIDMHMTIDMDWFDQRLTWYILFEIRTQNS